MRVALLEDDSAIQEMLSLVLQDEGHSVLRFSSAEECLQAFSIDAPSAISHGVDLMIVDWRLSGSTTGMEVIQQFRQDLRLRNLPVILTTAATFTNTEELQNLHVALLEKPFSVDDMIALVKKLTHS